MNLDRFVTERGDAWAELEELVRTARRRPQRLGPERILRLGALYRAAVADLALARRRFAGDPVVRRLEDLVGRARHLVYAAPTRRMSTIRFLRWGYWRLVAERPAALAVAALLLFAPAMLAGGWALEDRPAALGLVPSEFRDATGSERPWTDMPSGDQAAFSSAVLTNNVKVTFVAFAGGIAVGLLTAIVLVLNGVVLGAVAGLMIGAGNGVGFLQLVTGHGVLELSCIVVAGATGLRLGWSLVEPGRLTRGASLVREGRRAVAIVLGTAPWLVVAGIVEGFRAELAEAGAAVVVAVGFGLGAIYWGLVWSQGRHGPDPFAEVDAT